MVRQRMGVATIGLALAASLWMARPSVASACEVSGTDLRLEGLVVDAGRGRRIVLDVDHAQATVTLAARGAPRVRVRGALTFEATARANALPWSLVAGSRSVEGAVRVGTGERLSVSRVHVDGPNVRLTLGMGELHVHGVTFACSALRLWSAPRFDRAGVLEQLASLDMDRASRLWRWHWGAPPAPSLPGDFDPEHLIRAPRVSLRATADGPASLRVTGSNRLAVQRLEVAGSMARVRFFFEDGTEVTGWLPARGVRPLPPPETSGLGNLGTIGHGGGGGGGPRDTQVGRVFVGLATIAPGTPVHASPGGPEWATYSSARAARVQHRAGDDWVRVLEVPGVRLTRGQAWVPLAAVRLDALARFGLALEGGPAHRAQVATTWTVRAADGEAWQAFGIRAGDELISVERRGEAPIALGGAHASDLEAVVTDLYEQLFAARRWSSSVAVPARVTLVIQRAGRTVRLPVPVAARSLWCEQLVGNAHPSACPTGLTEVLRAALRSTIRRPSP